MINYLHLYILLFRYSNS